MSGVYPEPRTFDEGTLKRSPQTTAFGTAGVSISQKGGRVYKVRFVCKSATAYFAQIHDKTTAPTTNDVPVWEGKLPGNGDLELDFGQFGLPLKNGLGLAISSTGDKVTLAGADDAFAFPLYTATG